MSEDKRVPLLTTEFTESLGYSSKEKKSDKSEKYEPSFRFNLVLPESNEKTCPEFNYLHLLEAAQKKRKKERKKDDHTSNGRDPFDEDDSQELKDMAKRFEAKYGTSTIGKKRHKYNDGIDLGAGYDENDSFIDNTDAYDEIVPEEMTTAMGGFYINCGPLEFKADEKRATLHNNNNTIDDNESSDENDDEVEAVDSPKHGEKRSLIVSDNEDFEISHNNQPQKKLKLIDGSDRKAGHQNIVKKKKKSQEQLQPTVLNSEISNKNKDKIDTVDLEDATVSENQIIKKKKEKPEITKIKPPLEKKLVKKPINLNGFDGKKSDPQKLDDADCNYDDAIESVVNAARVDDESSRSTFDSGKSNGNPASDSECDDNEKEDVTLFDSLPDEVKSIVNELKVCAEASKEGKSKSFNVSVNTLLFRLEKKLRKINSVSMRSQTYSHLAHFLPYSKATLGNKAKKLYLQDAERKVQEPMERLKKIIDDVMPSILEKYMKESQNVADEKGFESPPSPESSDEDDTSSKKSEKSKIPRRKFPWTEESRKLICEIANARRQYFKILRPRKETLESFIDTFLKTKVIPLWPPGWMQLQTLRKYANPDFVMKKKCKKPKDIINSSNYSASTNSTFNPIVKLEHIGNIVTAEGDKTVTNPTKITSCTESTISPASNQGIAKSEGVIDKKQYSIKQKEKIKEINKQHEFSTNSTIGKISLVPTSQLMAQKPVKNHVEALNLLDLKNSSLSITPVNSDYHKSIKKQNEGRKEMDSITAYPESISITAKSSDMSQSGYLSAYRQDILHSSTPQIPFSTSEQISLSKSISIKHKMMSDNIDVQSKKIIENREYDTIDKTEKRERKQERSMYYKHKSLESKKRRKDQNIIEQPLGSSGVEIVPMPQQPSLTKEEQEQRQIEETVAATNFLSQIINDDVSTQNITDKRKDNILIEDNIDNVIQPSEQEKNVEMVMKSLEKLQELQCSPSHSPCSGNIQKPSKSNSPYLNLQPNYQNLYHNKDSKLGFHENAHW